MGNLYEETLETQVNVAQDEGERVEKGYISGNHVWFNFRIASVADGNRKLDTYFIKHIEKIGLSGWDFKHKVSRWVGFDFDSVIGHKKGLSDNELNELLEKAKTVPWLTIRRSTSGNGYHFYVFFKEPPKTDTRAIHAALARSILSILSAACVFDFKSKADTAGGILWVWRRGQENGNNRGFELIKKGELLEKNQVPVIELGKDKEFKGKQLAVNIRHVTFTPDQQLLIDWFIKQKTKWWWDSEFNMLVCHTHDLRRAHGELNLRGLFYTASEGKDWPNDINCFAFPLKNGSWIVRRYNPGCNEHSYWKTDKSGWTYCYYNRIPGLADIAPIFEGQLSVKKDWVFEGWDRVEQIIKILSPSVEIKLPVMYHGRQYRVKELGHGKLSILFERYPQDTGLPGWICNKKTFEKVIGHLEEELDVSVPDDLIRHIVSNNKDAGWYVNVRGNWIDEPKTNIESVLLALGYGPRLIDEMIGQCVLNSWELVNEPFSNEYPGNRKWNKYAPKLMFEPKEGDWSEWRKVLEHTGKSLDDAVKNNSWCVAYGINSGWQYLMMWCAALFQYPTEPLPFLFMWGQQLSGKSTFHEALRLLTDTGVKRAENALKNQNRFNAELLGAILCVVEEVNLRESPDAYERIKDWVTSQTLVFHEKGKTPFELPNTTHWIHCANNPGYCPVTFGDTRIVVLYIEAPTIVRSKNEMMEKLKVQGPAFTHQLLSLEIPPPSDRLRIPVVESQEKADQQISSANLVEQFILNKCHRKRGKLIKFSLFCDAFREYAMMHGENVAAWSNNRIGRSIPISKEMPVKGRYGDGAQLHLGNIAFEEDVIDEDVTIVVVNNKLIKQPVG